MALIYLVEDDESIREIESIALKNSGHEVIGFENATAFFKGIESIIPDLILLDVMLPDMNGNEILARLRKKTDTRKVPVIMVTAKTTELDMIKSLDDGADDIPVQVLPHTGQKLPRSRLLPYSILHTFHSRRDSDRNILPINRRCSKAFGFTSGRLFYLSNTR